MLITGQIFKTVWDPSNNRPDDSLQRELDDYSRQFAEKFKT